MDDTDWEVWVNTRRSAWGSIICVVKRHNLCDVATVEGWSASLACSRLWSAIKVFVRMVEHDSNHGWCLSDRMQRQDAVTDDGRGRRMRFRLRLGGHTLFEMSSILVEAQLHQ